MKLIFYKPFLFLAILLTLTGFAASDHYTFPNEQIEYGESDVSITIDCDDDEGTCATGLSYSHLLKKEGCEVLGSTGGSQLNKIYEFEFDVPSRFDTVDKYCDINNLSDLIFIPDSDSMSEGQGGSLEIVPNNMDAHNGDNMIVNLQLVDHGFGDDFEGDFQMRNFQLTDDLWEAEDPEDPDDKAVMMVQNYDTYDGSGSDNLYGIWHVSPGEDPILNLDDSSMSDFIQSNNVNVVMNDDNANDYEASDVLDTEFSPDQTEQEEFKYGEVEELESWQIDSQTPIHDNGNYVPDGEIIVGDNAATGNGPKFFICRDGQNTEVRANGDTYDCDEGTQQWELVKNCPDPGIGLDDSDNIRMYEDLNGDDYTLEVGEFDCEYENTGELEEFDTHPVNRENLESHQHLEEPYAFECNYDTDDYSSIDRSDFTLDGFNESRWEDYSPLDLDYVGNRYDEVREYEAEQYCIDIIEAIDQEYFVDGMMNNVYNDRMPVAEYYHSPSSMPLSQSEDSWIQEDGERRIMAAVGDVALDRFVGEHPGTYQFNGQQQEFGNALKHFRFQSLWEAHSEGNPVSNFFPYVEGYRLFHGSDDCSESVNNRHCLEFLDPLDWTYEEDEYLESDNVDIDDLYGSETSAWNVSNANAYLSDDVERHSELENDVEDLVTVSDRHAMEEDVFHGGFVPNCPDGEVFQFTANHDLEEEEKLSVNEGSEVWKCAPEGLQYQPEIYFPQVEELGAEPNQDINIGIFFPPSTFEYYEENDNVPSSRSHLDPSIGERNMRTAAEAVERSEPVDTTPRVRGMDVVCALGDEDRVTPENYENIIPDSQKFERENIQVPRPPMNEVRGSLDTPYAGVKAPLPVTGEIPGFPTTTGEHDTITCIWRYRYAGDFEEEWFTSGEAQSRDWDTSDLPNQEVDSEITSDQVEEYQEAWQLTTDEEANAEQRADSDFEDTSSLPFNTDSITDMIDSVLELLG